MKDLDSIIEFTRIKEELEQEKKELLKEKEVLFKRGNGFYDKETINLFTNDEKRYWVYLDKAMDYIDGKLDLLNQLCQSNDRRNNVEYNKMRLETVKKELGI